MQKVGILLIYDHSIILYDNSSIKSQKMSFQKINNSFIIENFNEENNNYNKTYFFQASEKLNNILNSIKSTLFKNIDDEISREINSYLNKINEIFGILLNSLNTINYSSNQNEIIQRKNE